MPLNRRAAELMVQGRDLPWLLKQWVERTPDKTFLSLPGFASTDKERQDIQAWEDILGAALRAFHRREHRAAAPWLSARGQLGSALLDLWWCVARRNCRDGRSACAAKKAQAKR